MQKIERKAQNKNLNADLLEAKLGERIQGFIAGRNIFRGIFALCKFT